MRDTPEQNDMKDILYINRTTLIAQVVFIVFLFSTILTNTSVHPIKYAAIAVLGGVIVVMGAKQTSPSIQAPKTIVYLFSFIFIIYFLNSVLNPEITELARASVFLYFFVCCCFFIPKLITQEVFLSSISIVSLIILCLGIPAAFIQADSSNIIGSLQYYASYDILSIEISQITSIMSNPNPLGKLAYFGLTSNLIYYKSNKKVWFFTSAILLVGLILTGSRAAFLSTAVALFVYIVGSSPLRKYTVYIAIAILVSIATGIIIFVQSTFLLSPTFSVGLSGRIGIWSAAVDAITSRPVTGYGAERIPSVVSQYTDLNVGAGVYNSFLRLSISTGIFGGIAYLFIYRNVLWSPTFISEDSKSNLIIYSLITGYAVDELFSGNAIFGVSIMSVLAMCCIGYIFRYQVKNQIES